MVKFSAHGREHLVFTESMAQGQEVGAFFLVPEKFLNRGIAINQIYFFPLVDNFFSSKLKLAGVVDECSQPPFFEEFFEHRKFHKIFITEEVNGQSDQGIFAAQ